MSTNTDRRRQQLVSTDETEPVCGYDVKHDGGCQNIDDDDKSVMLQMVTEIPVDIETRDDCDVKDTEEHIEGEDEYPDTGYSRRKAILEQVLSEYDQQHQKEKKLYQNKIIGLQRNSEKQKNQYISDINTIKDIMDDKLTSIETSMEETMELEREERNAAFQEIEEHMVMRDHEVEGLLKIIAMQGDELEQAKVEREELKKEIQNILLTLHVQFERYDEKGFKSNAELTILRDDHAETKKSLTEEVSKLKQCLCMIQENVDQVQKETCEIVTDTKNKITEAQRDTQAQFHKLLDEQQSIVSGYLQRNNDKFEKINADIKGIRSELDTQGTLCAKFNEQQCSASERIKSSETAIIECRTVITELNDYVYNDTAEAMGTLMSEKDNIGLQMKSLTETMVQVQGSMSDMNNKINADKLDMEFMDVKLKDALSTLDQKVQEQEIFLTNEINSTNESVKTVVEVMGSKLTDLRIEIQKQEREQGDTNKEFQQKTQELTEALEVKHQKIELSNREVADMIEKMKGFTQLHRELKSQFNNAQAKHAVEIESSDTKMSGLDSKFDGLMKMIQQRAEVQSLASKDFKATQNDFELKMKSCCTQLNELERRLTHAEGALADTVTTGLVDVMMQPCMNQNEHIADMIKKLSEELKMMRDQAKMTQIDRVAISEKVDNMNKTWEALFQHLAGQMQKDTVDLNKMKKETDSTVKDVIKLTAAWEKHLSVVVKGQDMSQQASTTIKSLQVEIESCNDRIKDLFHKMERMQQLYSDGKELKEETSKVSLQASVEKLFNA